ncbi:MAG: PadR family transcriptional regulator [Acidobacteriota bacterium]
MARRRRSTDDDGALSALMLQILLVLSEGERHGYGMLQEIEQRSRAPFRLGPATLYRTLKRLLDARFIAEVESGDDHAQRRRYRITDVGRRRAKLEATRLEGLVDWAHEVRVLGSETKG